MYAKKILLKSDNIFLKNTGLTFDPNYLINVITLDNDDIDISMSHILPFPKIYNLAVRQLIKQISNNRYPATLLLVTKDSRWLQTLS